MTTIWKTVSCSRCGGERYPHVDTPEPYTCYRCRAVLAGWPPVADPRPTEAQRLAGERLAKKRQK